MMRVLLLLLLAGCGGGSGVDPFVGTWRNTIIGKDNVGQVNCPGTLTENGQTINSCGPNDQITFGADGSFTLVDQQNGVVSGRWQLNGSTLTLTIQQPSQGTVVANTVRNGNQLTVRDSAFPSEFAVWIK